MNVKKQISECKEIFPKLLILKMFSRGCFRPLLSLLYTSTLHLFKARLALKLLAGVLVSRTDLSIVTFSRGLSSVHS